MGYYCPNCGHPVDGNIFFQAAGQCMCSQCGEIVDLLNVSEAPPEHNFDNENCSEEEED